MANQQSVQRPQAGNEGHSSGTPRPQRNTGEGSDSALALLKRHRRVEDLVNRELPPECESEAAP